MSQAVEMANGSAGSVFLPGPGNHFRGDIGPDHRAGARFHQQSPQASLATGNVENIKTFHGADCGQKNMPIQQRLNAVGLAPALVVDIGFLIVILQGSLPAQVSKSQSSPTWQEGT